MPNKQHDLKGYLLPGDRLCKGEHKSIAYIWYGMDWLCKGAKSVHNFLFSLDSPVLRWILCLLWGYPLYRV